MGNRQTCAKFQENLFRSNEIISIFCPPLFRKWHMTFELLDNFFQVCKLFRHIASTEPLVITAEHNEMILRSMGPLVSITLTVFTVLTLINAPPLINSPCLLSENNVIQVQLSQKAGCTLSN